MKKLKYIFTIVLLSVVFFSCDLVQPPDNSLYYIADTVSNSSTDTQATVVKKVLMVDFTGIQCVNCPNAHEQIHQLQNVYPDKVVAVVIHGTLLAYPYGDYHTDLRTTEGNAIISDFGINSIPIGLVDYFDKDHLKQVAEWTNDVASQVAETPTIGIEIVNTYKSADNTVDVQVNLTSLSDFGKSLKLAVYVTEDSIVTRQATTEDPGYIENYVQLNVFRKAVSDVYGDEVFASPASVNDTDSKTYTLVIDSSWNVKNCKIVAFIIDDTKKVLNVNIEKIQ